MSVRRFFPTASLVAVSLLGLIGSAPRPARAGVVVPLPAYQGAAHHNTKAAEENDPFSFTITGFNGNKFGAVVTIPEKLDLTVSGKITNAVGANRKFTFSGVGEGLGGTLKLKNGVGAVSATGVFIVGSFQISGPGAPELNGGFTFSGALPLSGLGAGAPFGVASPRVIAPLANISNLKDLYRGAIHSGSSPDFEDSAISLTVTSTKPGGAFQGILGGVPISGKVAKTGKVTFAGVLNEGNASIKLKAGKAQLSAQGDFLLGSFTAVGTGGFADQSGKYTLGSTSLE